VAPDGTLTRSQSFDVYGCVRTSSGTATTKHKFVGSLGHPSDDETGLIYLRARHYDPVCGRFVSEDPAGDGDNPLAYCDNDPAIFVDRTGKVKTQDIPGMPGWTFRIDRAYWNGVEHVQDVALEFRGTPMGSFIRGSGPWKHGPFGRIPTGVREWALSRLGTTLAVCSVVAYFNQNPLDFIAIMLTVAGDFDTAREIDAING
jgi:RHS repeat-associated protein